MSGVAPIERPRGTHDVVPAEMPSWRRVTDEIERLCALYGYRKILTPVFEDTALFARTSGAGSDVVQKEMYTFTDRADRSLTLRPEGTAPICRAYVEHGMHREPAAREALHDRHDVPLRRARQRGRYREHWQASVEALGTDDPAIDAELIQLYDTLLARLGVTRYHLELNSIGCRECRPAYLETPPRVARRERRAPRRRDARRRRDVSPLRVFDNYLAKPPAVREALDEAPKIGESLCDACVEHFAAVRAGLDATGVALHARPDPRPRPRLLLAHDVRVHRPDGEPELDHHGRRALRLPRRGDRRAADTRDRLRRGHRAAADRDGGGGRRGAAGPGIDVFFALEDGAPRERGRALAGRAPRGRASRPRPTTRAARSRDS